MPQEDWNQDASNLLKAELARDNVKYDELLIRLKALGVNETYQSLAAKINRGTFSFSFFMQCMKAIDHSDIRLRK